MVWRTLHIGVGGRGRWPVRMFPGRDDVEVVGLCDIRPEALAEAREATGLWEAACYTDWREALRLVDCDLVVIITPPQLHAEMCLEAIRSGRHVFVEKPFTMDLVAARQIVDEADARGLKLAVGQQARYSAGLQLVASLRDSGRLGPAVHGLMVRQSLRPGVHHSGEQRHSYAWERGIHDFDTAWALFGGHPATVQAREFNPPQSPYAHGAGMSAIVEFDTGGVCTIDACFMSHGKLNGIWIDYEAGSLAIGSKEVTLTPPDGEPETIEVPPSPAAEQVVVDGFLHWLNDGEEPVCGMHHNLWVMAMVAATGLSADEHRLVNVPALLGQGG